MHQPDHSVDELHGYEVAVSSHPTGKQQQSAGLGAPEPEEDAERAAETAACHQVGAGRPEMNGLIERSGVRWRGFEFDEVMQARPFCKIKTETAHLETSIHRTDHNWTLP